MMRQMVKAVPALGLAAILAATVGCPMMNGDDGGVATVRMRGIAFNPDEITIEAGETVRWVNDELLPIVHTVTSGNPGDPDLGDLFDSGDISPGGSFEHTFSDPGDFVYHCQTHPDQMRDAVVHVTPAP